MDVRTQPEELALRCGLDFFSVASMDRFGNAPPGHRPWDLLPEGRLVISVGIRIPRGAIEANNRAYEGLRHGIFTYMLFGYNRLNEIIDHALLNMCRVIEREYEEIAYPIPASIPRDEEKLMGAMSNRHAAVAAGLAEFGWIRAA